MREEAMMICEELLFLEDEQPCDAKLKALFCDEVLQNSPYGKLETLQRAVTCLMECAGREIAIKHSGTEALNAFILASEFEQYVTSIRSKG